MGRRPRLSKARRTAAPGDPIDATGRRLVVVGFRLTMAGHWYNELLGYASAARNLGWPISILVPKSAGKDMARAIPAKRKLDYLPVLSEDEASEFENDPAGSADQMAALISLWSALDKEHLRESDLVLFVHADPRLLVGIGTWLSRRTVDARPNVFFRFIGYEILDPHRNRSQTSVSMRLRRMLWPALTGTRFTSSSIRCPSSGRWRPRRCAAALICRFRNICRRLELSRIVNLLAASSSISALTRARARL